MVKQKRNQKVRKKQAQTQSMSTYMLNVLIFLLLTVIIYLAYSLFVKLNTSEELEVEVRNSKKHAEIIQAEVLNGCGVSGVADRFTDYLRDNNIDIVKTGNYERFDIDETIVLDRIGNKANALYVADILGVREGNAFTQLNNDYFVDVTIIIGRDYYKQLPIKKE